MRYSGDFKDDKYHGEGEYIWAEGINQKDK